MAEADARDAALLLNDLLRLTGPALGEGELGALGLVVGDALGAPAAALAGVDHEQRIRFVQAVLPRQVAGQHHDAVPGVLIGLLHLFVGAVHGVGAGDLVFQNLLCHGHGLEKAGVLILLGVPHRVKKADGIAQAVLLAGVVVEVQRLDKVLVDEPGLPLAHKAGAQHPPQQAKGRVGHTVCAVLPGLLMMVEHAIAHIVHDAVKAVRHHKAAGDLDIRAQDLQQRSGKHIVGVELAGMGKAVCRNFHRCTSFPIKSLATVYHTLPKGTTKSPGCRGTAGAYNV